MRYLLLPFTPRYILLTIAILATMMLPVQVILIPLFLIGTAGGLSEQNVATALTLSQFAGVAGALLPASLGSRFGRWRPLSVGIAGGAVALAFLIGRLGLGRVWSGGNLLPMILILLAGTELVRRQQTWRGLALGFALNASGGISALQANLPSKMFDVTGVGWGQIFAWMREEPSVKV